MRILYDPAMRREIHFFDCEACRDYGYLAEGSPPTLRPCMAPGCPAGARYREWRSDPDRRREVYRPANPVEVAFDTTEGRELHALYREGVGELQSERRAGKGPAPPPELRAKVREIAAGFDRGLRALRPPPEEENQRLRDQNRRLFGEIARLEGRIDDLKALLSEHGITPPGEGRETNERPGGD